MIRYLLDYMIYTPINPYFSNINAIVDISGPRMHHLIINRAMAPSATSKAQQLLQVCLLVVVLNVMNDN